MQETWVRSMGREDPLEKEMAIQSSDIASKIPWTEKPDRLQFMGRKENRMWSTGEGKGKPLQYSCLYNPMNGMKRQKDMTLKDELPRSVGAKYTTGDQKEK